MGGVQKHLPVRPPSVGSAWPPPDTPSAAHSSVLSHQPLPWPCPAFIPATLPSHPSLSLNSVILQKNLRKSKAEKGK